MCRKLTERILGILSFKWHVRTVLHARYFPTWTRSCAFGRNELSPSVCSAVLELMYKIFMSLRPRSFQRHGNLFLPKGLNFSYRFAESWNELVCNRESPRYSEGPDISIERHSHIPVIVKYREKNLDITKPRDREHICESLVPSLYCGSTVTANNNLIK